MLPSFEILAEGLAFPEAPFWSDRDGCLYLVEWTGDRLLAFRDGKLERFPDRARRRAERIIPGCARQFLGSSIFKLYAGLFQPRRRAAFGRARLPRVAFPRPCDLVGETGGGVYFTDSGDFDDDWRTGRPARRGDYCSPAGQLVEIERGLCYPNGIASAGREAAAR